MKKAAFTVWFNDLVILDVWIRYYKKEFDLYVIIDQPKHLDEIAKREAEGIKFIRGEQMESVLCANEKIKEVQKDLLKDYDWVLFSNCDEIFVPDPKYKSFDELIKDKDSDYIASEAFEIVEWNEPPIDFTKPLLKQRKYWMKNYHMNKITLSRVPLNWTKGQHRLEETTDQDTESYCDIGLYLLHLRHINLQDDGNNPRDFGPFLHPPHNHVLTHLELQKCPMPEWVKDVI